ncbi:MAG: hypothetical protein F6K55_01090 [Moorea sp. SIO4A3]|nr:hypothetical protein [Moorena sp. SIO4A3]
MRYIKFYYPCSLLPAPCSLKNLPHLTETPMFSFPQHIDKAYNCIDQSTFERSFLESIAESLGQFWYGN